MRETPMKLYDYTTKDFDFSAWRTRPSVVMMKRGLWFS
jgi:hypothetical protein